MAILDLSTGREITDGYVIRIDNDVAIVGKKSKCDIVNLNNRNISLDREKKMRYDNVDIFHGNFAITTVNINLKSKRYGLIDKNGNEILEPIYEDITFDEFGFNLRINTWYNYITLEGKMIGTKSQIPLHFTDGVSPIKDENNKCGVIDINGDMVIECEYKKLKIINSERFIVTDDFDKKGLINKNNEFIIKPVNELVVTKNYKHVYLYKMGVVYSKWQIRDLDGNIIKRLLNPRYDESTNTFFEVHWTGYLYALIDDHYNQITKYKYEDIDVFHRGYAAFIAEGGCGLVDKMGNEIIKPGLYSEITYRSNGIFTLYKNKQYGFFKDGQIITEPIYDSFEVKDKVCIVSKKGKYWLINYDNQNLIDLGYDEYINSDSNYHLFKIKDRNHLLDNDGNLVLDIPSSFVKMEIKDELIHLYYSTDKIRNGYDIHSLYDIKGNQYFENVHLDFVGIVNRNQVIINNVIINTDDIKYQVDDSLNNLRKQIMDKYYNYTTEEFEKCIQDLHLNNDLMSLIEQLKIIKIEHDQAQKEINKRFINSLNILMDNITEEKGIELVKKS